MHRPAPLVLAALAAAIVGAAGLVFLLTRTESSADHAIQGDVNCDMAVGAVDAMHVLKTVAEIPTDAGCLDLAADTDCDDEIDPVDSLRILRYVVQLTNSAVAGCTPIGEPLEDSLTPTATPTSSPGVTLTTSPTPTATATPALTPKVTPPAGGYALSASGITTAWNDGLDFALIPGSPGEAAVIRQGGEVWKVFLDGTAPVIMGDISGRVASGGEEGLLSLAFSPDFENDHRLYVYYTASSCLAPSVIRCHHLSRLDVTGGVMDEGSEVVVLEIPITHPDVKFQSNHNGGSVRFGQDGMLYVSVGDGGGGGDPSETGQDNTDLLGSVLRLDVVGQGTYLVPGDNPFADGDPGADLVWAYGLRNPWRMSVDSLNGDIWLGDVGQNEREEVDRIIAGGNHGWNTLEGNNCYDPPSACTAPSGYVAPRADYGHGGGNQAVAGGYVYRGAAMPELYGHYVYADTYSGRIWAVNTAGDDPPVELMNTDEFIYSFAELADGELLVLTVDGIFRLSHA